MSDTKIENLFASIAPLARCPRCLDTGVWLSPTNAVEICPRLLVGNAAVHQSANPAAFLMQRAARRLKARQENINPFAFDLARILTQYTTQTPCLRLDLADFFYADTNLSAPTRRRRIQEMVEELRKIWLLPIGSRKLEPSGYWIITDLEDFKEWVNRVKAAPITQLTTIHRVARHNFPVFAEQIELEFFTNLKNGDGVADVD